MTIPYYMCALCGHEWIPRSQKPPKVCPNCKSERWDKYKDAVVYFVQKGENGPIKVGITTSIYSRMNLLKTHCEAPIKILAIINGGRKKEAEIAKRFSHLILSGEWYSPDKSLLNYIESLDKKIEIEPRVRGRPLTCGKAISLRLPLKEDTHLMQEAKKRNISPGELIKKIIEKWLLSQKNGPSDLSIKTV